MDSEIHRFGILSEAPDHRGRGDEVPGPSKIMASTIHEAFGDGNSWSLGVLDGMYGDPKFLCPGYMLKHAINP